MMPRKLILRTNLCPGDVVMLTAAVRDLHSSYPGEYITDVRTPCPALWEHNPNITPMREEEAEVIDVHYPLINQSNQGAFHFIHGYRMFLEEKLDRCISSGPFKGDIHLSEKERGWMSQVEEKEGVGTRFWIVVSGGKRDYTAKWWDPARMQDVVDHFSGRIRFVQVGEGGHHHPSLRGVLDLRGKTTLRQLVRLVHHADGVVCPVTSLMHLAAAVPVRPRHPPLRPCVVIAGGREPSQWEAYPGHRYLDTIGALPCCASGGCWKSRVVPLNDGDEKDKSLCEQPVRRPQSLPLPRCLDLISAADVIRAVESYSPPAAPTNDNPNPQQQQEQKEKKQCCGGSDAALMSTAGTGEIGEVRDRPVKDAETWGPPLWAELHARPRIDYDPARELLWLRSNFAMRIPCGRCQSHFLSHLIKAPPKVETPDAYHAWTVDFHDKVNERLGKSVSPRNSPASQVGLVIGTYAALPYIHLQLESRRRFHPAMPCLVIDDGSAHRAQLAELCVNYGADFIGREHRMGHVPGDMQAFVDGHDWAQRREIGLLVKFSRRWIPITAWADEAKALWMESGATTLNNVCHFHGYGFRSEVVAMDVCAWKRADALKVVREHIEACVNHPPDLDCGESGILVEHVIHMAAATAKQFQRVDSLLNFGVWNWMGTSRRDVPRHVLWHETSKTEEYLAQMLEWNQPNYTLNDFLSAKQNIHLDR